LIINHRHRFIFYHVPKTAGVSIRTALLAQPDSRRVRPKHITPAQDGAPWRPLRLWRARTYFSFCFVRNPWERFGSLHRFLRSRPRQFLMVPVDINDFAALLGDRSRELMTVRYSIRPQSTYARAVSFVGRFEQLGADFARIADRLGIPARDLDRLNASGEETCYRNGMTARSQNIIADFYREDLARFGYR
jgi:hypothetical protein